MPLAGEDLYCHKFQPNIFDPSRCQTCLRLRHLHANVPPRDDSDDLSVVSSYCDISRDHLGCEEGSLYILSPDCELYICDEDDSTDSTQDPSDFPELSDSLSQEDDELAHQDGASYPTMTRLHPAPHRPNPQAWMEEARSRDGFSRQTGAKGQKDHDSGYLSLGRAGGIHSLKEKKPPAPYRHSEIGHPLPSHRSPEPKAAIPFRNPDLGVPSQRRSSETQGYDPSLANSPPSGISESSYGWNFDSGQRSLSPTPFKQAESLESTQHRRCDSSYSRGQQSSYSATNQQPGNLQRQSCTFSRSSSPSRSASPFRQADQSGMSSRRNFDFPQGSSQGPRTPSQNSYGRGLDIANVSKNFKSVANSIGSYSQTDSFANLRNSLRKKDVNVSSGIRSNSRDSSPSKRGYDTPSQTLLRKTDTKTTPNSYNRDSRSSSPSRKINETPSQTLLRKTDSKLATNSYSNNSRSSSPSRKGYDTPTQSILRKTDTGISTNTSSRDSHGSALSRRACNTPSQTILRKSEARGTSGLQGHNSQISTPSRRVGERLKKDSNMPCNSRNLNSRGSSPSRQGYNTSNYSILHKSETKSVAGIHGHGSRSPSPSRQSHDLPRPSFPPKTRSNSLSNTTAYDSRSSSPSRKVYDTNQPPLRKTTDIICRLGSVSSEIKKTTSQSSPSPGSWRSSSNSLHSPPISRSCSPSRRQGQGQHISKPTFITSEANSRGSSRNNSRQKSLEPHSPSPEHRQSFHHNPGLSPQSQRYTSSQSSLESESSHLSGGSMYVGLNKEEYALMADLPKVKTIYEREGPGQFGKSQNHILGKEELYKPASHTQTKEVYRDQAGLGERGKANGRECDQGQRHRQDREAGQLTRTQSSNSLHTQRSCSPSQEEGNHWKVQLKRSSGNSQELLPDRNARNCRSRFPSDETREKPDLLNFKKGWMSVLDEHGEWKKHWFVLTDSSLKYYRDSGAEEKDDLDGEIDLRSCVNVTEFDVEKNYGFQIQTLNAVFILSAMTAGIRKNWIEVLRKSVRTGNTPDITQLPDSSSDKENSHSLGRTPSSRQHPSWQSTGAATPPATAAVRRFDYVELAPVTVALGVMPTSLRGAGEGQAREKGLGTTMEQRQRMEEEIEKKWAEFEKLPLKRMCSLPPMSSLGGQPANEALQREVASLRQQLERKQSGGGGGGGGVGGMGHCGPEAPCGRSLEAMETAHQHALAELQRRHDRETRELEMERDRLLKEEAQATAQAMEALKKAHREEMERELEAVRRLAGASADVEALQRQQESERQGLQRELDGLSERYSQKCLELNRAMQSGGERERELSRREAEMEQLKKDNQVLQARVMEEISRMHSLAKSPGSDGVPHDGRQPDSCHLEVLLRMKENEVQYLLKEIGCLREELQALNMEKREACKRYKEVHAELSGMKSRSEREVVALKEHLKLAMAALQEGQRLGNSLDH